MSAALALTPAMAAPSEAIVTLSVAGQLCGVPVLGVRDILRSRPITRVPLAPPWIAGSLNLRGRIVTAIDLRRRLLLPPAPAQVQPMSVVTEKDSELYALLVDQVCEVLNPDAARLEANPTTLPANWARYSAGIYRLETTLMIVLDLARLLALEEQPS